jgi:hypothetical protein
LVISDQVAIVIGPDGIVGQYPAVMVRMISERMLLWLILAHYCCTQQPCFGSSNVPSDALSNNLVILVTQNIETSAGFLSLELALFLAMFEVTLESSPIGEVVSTKAMKEVGLPAANVEIPVGEFELAFKLTATLTVLVLTDVHVPIDERPLASSMHLVVQPVTGVA